MALGLIVCLALIVLLLPLVPILKMYDEVRSLYEDDGE